MKEVKTIFSEDYVMDKVLFYEEKETITDYAAILSDDVSDEIKKKGDAFAQEITDLFVSDFEKSEELLKAGKVDEKESGFFFFFDAGNRVGLTWADSCPEVSHQPLTTSGKELL